MRSQKTPTSSNNSQNVSSIFEESIEELKKEYSAAEERISKIKEELAKQRENANMTAALIKEISQIEEKQHEIRKKLHHTSIDIVTIARQLNAIYKNTFLNSVTYSKIRRLTDKLNMAIQNELIFKLPTQKTIEIEDLSNISTTLQELKQAALNLKDLLKDLKVLEVNLKTALKLKKDTLQAQAVKYVVLKDKCLEKLKDDILKKAKDDLLVLKKLKDAISDKTLTEDTLDTILKGLIDTVLEQALIDNKNTILKTSEDCTLFLLDGLQNKALQSLKNVVLKALENNTLQTSKNDKNDFLKESKEMVSQVLRNNNGPLLKNNAVITQPIPSTPSIPSFSSFRNAANNVVSSVSSRLSLFKKNAPSSMVRGQSMVEEKRLADDSLEKLFSTRPTRTASVIDYITSPLKKGETSPIRKFLSLIETLETQIALEKQIQITRNIPPIPNTSSSPRSGK
ncbi:MAG TPA: hypothetical protein VJN02_10335 [Gammaproteobacteria bacterium]|nr:hypothetical protein [Gammaproteobacteria bacterium]